MKLGLSNSLVRSAGQKWNPLNEADLAAFYDFQTATAYDATSGGSLVADGGTIKRWQDQKSTKHLTSAVGATYDIDGGPGGTPCAIFDGSDDFLGNQSASLGTTVTAYLVCRFPSWASNKIAFDFNSSGARASIWTHSTGYAMVTAITATAVYPVTNEWGVLVISGTTNKRTMKRNGCPVITSTAAASPNHPFIWLGAAGNPGTNVSNCALSIAAAAIFTATHDDATQAVIANKLKSRYRIAPAVKLVLCDGNSLTFGVGSTGGLTYPAQMQTLLGSGYRVDNFGVGGQTTAQMIADAATEVDTRIDSWARTICVAWEGRNSMTSGSTPAQAHADIQSYCLSRRAAGAKVIVGTVLPSNFLSEENRGAYNALVTANWQSYADALVDLAANPTIGAAGANTNLTYYDADQIHMNNTGYGVVAGLVGAVVATL